MNDHLCVSLIKDGVIADIYLFVGNIDDITVKGEEQFLKLCKTICQQFDATFTSDQIDDFLNDGYFDNFGESQTVCLTWINDVCTC